MILLVETVSSCLQYHFHIAVYLLGSGGPSLPHSRWINQVHWYEQWIYVHSAVDPTTGDQDMHSSGESWDVTTNRSCSSPTTTPAVAVKADEM